MPERKKDQQHKFKIPRLSPSQRRILYIFTIVSDVFSIISIDMEYPEWLKYIVYAAAFCSLCASGFYLVTVSRKEMQNSVQMVISRNSILDYLYSNYYERTFLFALPGFGMNIVFAGFNAVIGVCSLSAWYISFAVYYALLCLMRFYLLRYEFFGRKSREPDASLEWKIYARCGIILMTMSIALGGVTVLMVLKGNGKTYPGYLIYIVAAYTFWKIITSAANMIKAGKMKSPMIRGMRNIGYADALVSVLSLQTAMFASFHEGDGKLPAFMNMLTGSFVCLMVFLVGGGMAVSAALKLIILKQKSSNL